MNRQQGRSTAGKQNKARKPLHRDWRMWVAVVLMLGAIGIYVLTLDDAAEISAVNQVQTQATGN